MANQKSVRTGAPWSLSSQQSIKPSSKQLVLFTTMCVEYCWWSWPSNKAKRLWFSIFAGYTKREELFGQHRCSPALMEGPKTKSSVSPAIDTGEHIYPADKKHLRSFCCSFGYQFYPVQASRRISSRRGFIWHLAHSHAYQIADYLYQYYIRLGIESSQVVYYPASKVAGRYRGRYLKWSIGDFLRRVGDSSLQLIRITYQSLLVQNCCLPIRLGKGINFNIPSTCKW